MKQFGEKFLQIVRQHLVGEYFISLSLTHIGSKYAIVAWENNLQKVRKIKSALLSRVEVLDEVIALHFLDICVSRFLHVSVEITRQHIAFVMAVNSLETSIRLKIFGFAQFLPAKFNLHLGLADIHK